MGKPDQAPEPAVLEVWEAWLARQERPSICRLNAERVRLVRNALAEYDAPTLVTLIRYVYEADESGPRWLRGENPTGTRYLDIGSILRPSKIASRVEAAVAWSERPPYDPLDGNGSASAVDVEAMQRLARRRPLSGEYH